MSDSAVPYDEFRRRPLLIHVQRDPVLPDSGGYTEDVAESFCAVTADVLVLLRTMIDPTSLHLLVTAVEGETGGPIAPSALFHLWVAFTGHMARVQAPEGDEQAARQIAFCKKVLLLMQLDETMGPLAPATAAATSAPETSGSTPESHTAQPGDAPSSTD